jgi:aconitate hydratase
MLLKPPDNGKDIDLVKGPNIAALPDFDPLPDTIEIPAILKVGDDISTDEIMPAGAKVLPFRSNIPEISKFVFSQMEKDFYDRAIKYKKDGFFIIGGENYGQGSSREHAAIAPRFLGLKAVIAKSFARIHWQNLVNFGILPLTFVNKDDYQNIEQGNTLYISGLKKLREKKKFEVVNKTKNINFEVEHSMTERQTEMVISGGLINVIKNKIK